MANFHHHLSLLADSLLVIVGLLVCSVPISAQEMSVSITPRQILRENTLDDLLYTVTYQAETIRNPDKPQSVDRDELRLEIGSKRTKLYSVPLHEADSVATEDLKKGAKGVKPFAGFAQMEDVYSFPDKGEVAVFVRDIMGGVSPCYKEPIPKIDWQLGNKTKELLGYDCKSAECDFRGRHYTVWYAPDLPLSYGPWKFCGLPGLILELTEESGAFHYIATSLHKASPGAKLVQWIIPSRMVTKKEALNAQRYMFAHPAKYAEEMYDLYMSRDGKRVVDGQYYSYNPIELE